MMQRPMEDAATSGRFSVGQQVRLEVDPNRLFVFCQKTEERIHFGLEERSK
jgi:hypothetical protein